MNDKENGIQIWNNHERMADGIQIGVDHERMAEVSANALVQGPKVAAFRSVSIMKEWLK